MKYIILTCSNGTLKNHSLTASLEFLMVSACAVTFFLLSIITKQLFFQFQIIYLSPEYSIVVFDPHKSFLDILFAILKITYTYFHL